MCNMGSGDPTRVFLCFSGVIGAPKQKSVASFSSATASLSPFACLSAADFGRL